MAERMSVARALVELKMLEKKIGKAIGLLDPVTMTIGGRLPTGIRNQTEFEKEAKAGKQKIDALISRRRAIKAAVVNSNAGTKVCIGGKEMTVAEAIERKNSIEVDREFLEHLVSNWTAVEARIISRNNKMEERLQANLQELYGKESSSKIKSEEYEALARPFRKDNEAKLVDPLGVKNIITKMREDIDDFESNVDITLTESNARTDIEI